MKVMNKGSQVVNVVLADGEKHIHKGDVVEMPKWVYNMLIKVFPALTIVEDVVEAEPAVITPKDEPKPEVKNAKGKKSRK